MDPHVPARKLLSVEEEDRSSVREPPEFDLAKLDRDEIKGTGIIFRGAPPRRLMTTAFSAARRVGRRQEMIPVPFISTLPIKKPGASAPRLMIASKLSAGGR